MHDGKLASSGSSRRIIPSAVSRGDVVEASGSVPLAKLRAEPVLGPHNYLEQATAIRGTP